MFTLKGIMNIEISPKKVLLFSSLLDCFMVLARYSCTMADYVHLYC